jgi:hypothetical protein
MVIKNCQLQRDDNIGNFGDPGDGNDGEESQLPHIHYGYRILCFYTHVRGVREAGKEIDGVLRERPENGAGGSQRGI